MITFKEDTHQYFDEDGKELISVTTLMAKHGLAPDYSGVDPLTLKTKAERGRLIHKEIEDFIKNGNIGFTKELEGFIAYLNESGAKVLGSEMVFHNDIVAGTCDLMLNYKHGWYTIADIKTTSVLHKDSVSWQLSIYAYLNGNPLVREGQAFHFDADGNLKVVDIPLKPMEEVEKLMECERRGEIYKQDLPVPLGQLALIAEAQAIIEEADRMKKEAEKRMGEVKEAILKAMEERGIKTFENEDLRITYVAPTERGAIDAAKLKAEMPEIAEKYKTTTKVKASVRITMKGEKQ